MGVVWPPSTCFGACCYHIPTVIRYADARTAQELSAWKLEALAEKTERLRVLTQEIKDKLDTLNAASIRASRGVITLDRTSQPAVVRRDSAPSAL